MMFGELAIIKSNNRACLDIANSVFHGRIINHSMHIMHSWDSIILRGRSDISGMFMEERKIAL